MQDDGNLVFYASGGEPLWDTGTSIRDIRDSFSGSVPVNYELSDGDTITAPNGFFRLTMQSDGNPVIYSSDGNVMWAAGVSSPHARLVPQADGNLVIYSAKNLAIWSTNTKGSGKSLSMTDDGRAVLTSGAGSTIWETAPASTTARQFVSAGTIGSAVSAAIDSTRRATSEERAVIVPSSSIDMVREAAVMATLWDASLIVTDSDTDASQTNARMSSLNTTRVRLYGTSRAFPSSFISGLKSGTTIDKSILADRAYDRTSQMWDLSTRKEQLVIAATSSAENLPMAAALAMERKAPLLIVGDQSDNQKLYNSLNSSLKEKTHPGIVQIGNALDLSQFTADEVKKKIETFDVGERDSAWLRISTRAMSAHSSGLDLWTAPSDQPAHIIVQHLRRLEATRSSFQLASLPRWEQQARHPRI
ncbi:D-mannose binding lectin [Rathayibacter tanaceti]|nr:D-mannose binding lectin [Rathayibacter tanaceti]